MRLSPNYHGLLVFTWRDREIKIIENRIGQNISSSPECHVIGGSIASINYNSNSLEHMRCVLVDGILELHRQIGSALKLAYQFLLIRDVLGYLNALFHGLNTDGHRHGNSVHNSGGTRGLTDRSAHIGGLAFGDFVHFCNCLFKSLSLQAVNNQLDQSEKNDDSSQADHPPIGRRLIIALCLFIGGFLLSLRGWEHTNNDRRLISTAQIVCGLGLSGRGVLLWLVTERRLSRCRNAGTSRHWTNDAPASNPCKYCHWGNSFSNSESVICFVQCFSNEPNTSRGATAPFNWYCHPVGANAGHSHPSCSSCSS